MINGAVAVQSTTGAGGYFVGSGGASTIQGHTLIVFTFVLLFLTTVIFIAPSPSSPPQGSW